MIYQTQAIVDMVKASMQNSQEVIKNIGIPVSQVWGEMYRTSIHLPRRSGHSTAAFLLMQDDETSLVILNTHAMKRHFISENGLDGNTKRVWTAFEAEYSLRGLKVLPKTIIHDNASYMSNREIEIVRREVHVHSPFMIYLG